MALTLTMLLMFAGFMVDLGAWYQQSQDIQRTADAAALAGATYLPDNPGPANATPSNCGTSVANIEASTPTNAYCAALKVIYKNGYTNANITAAVDGANDRQLDVTIQQGNISQYFTSFFMGPLTFTRNAHAQFSQAVALGSPQNYFGTGTLRGFTGFVGNSTPNFWASIAGYCEAKEAGDEYAAGFDGNVSNVHTGTYVRGGSFPTDCNPTQDTGRIGTSTPTCVQAQKMNCEFDPAGYTYTIVVPPGASANQRLWIFNARYNPCLNQPAYDAGGNLVPAPSPPYTSPLMDTDSNLSTMYSCGGSVPGGATNILTYYSLVAPDGTVDTYKASTSHSLGPTPGYPTWTDLLAQTDTSGNSFPWSSLTTGTWYLNVSTMSTTLASGTFQASPTASDANQPSYGVHNYGLLVSPKIGGSGPSSNLKNGGSFVCSTQPCPTVFANTSTAEAATIVSTGGASAATAYLANVPTAAVGKTVTLKIWDPGDYAQYIQVMKPDGSVLGSNVGDPVINYAVYGADPAAVALYGGTLPNPNNTPSASGTLNGCTDPLTSSTFAGSSGPCFPVDGCVPLDASNTGNQTPLTDCGTDLQYLGQSSPPNDWGAPNNRYGMSRYSDAMVTLTFVAPVAGWYGIQEVTNQASVHDTITLNLLINGLPPHLTP
ncbi:MAG TPA: pilus assembly protein TadG-related protein [Acidimicrobiales bacterium]|nr:pilus assembly protein TadG-related protein [Acidimicrobiales bacterium]